MSNSVEFVTANKSFSGTDMVAVCQMTGPDGFKSMYTFGSLQTLTYSIHMDRRPIRSIGNINAKDYVMGPRTIAGSLVFAVFNKHFAYEAMEDIRNKYNPRYAFLADELPPFDVTISFANEYGAQAKLVLYGIRLVNEGQVMSVNDIYTENTYQFVATDIEYLTDTNGYSSTLSLSKTRLIQDTKPIVRYSPAKDLKDKIKNPSTDTKPTIVTLNIQSVSPQIGDKNGIVRMTLNPWQETGKITIEGPNLPNNIDIDVSEYKNQSIYLALPANQYKAKYEDVPSRKYSLKKDFIIGRTDAVQSKLLAAPIIEYCTDRKISVYSNVPNHKKLKYAEVDGTGDLTYKEVALTGRRVLLQGLKADTKYILYTFDNTTESMRIYAQTEAFYERPYNDLIMFVTYNESKLKYGYLTDYIRIINEAKAIALTSNDYVSPSTAISTYKDKMQKKLTTINRNDYPSYDAYIAAFNAIVNDITVCCYLLMSSNMLENDNAVAVNPPITTAVKPPVPELADAINCVFAFDPSIEWLEFYRQYSNTAQFALEVKKVSFYDYLDGKKGFKFQGKPGINHYVYAFDKAGHRSPKLQFYVMTDEEKARELEFYYTESQAIAKMLLDKENEIGTQLDALKLTPDNRKRLLVQECKTADLSVFPAPVITSIANDKVVLNVDYKDSTEQYSNEFFVSISSVNDALYKRSVYKKKIESDTIEFTTNYGGIKPDMKYAVWVEDSLGSQVSPCITFSTYSTETDETEAEEERITLNKTGQMLTQIRTLIGNKIQITDEVESSINNLKEDTSITWNNVFDKLAQNILSYTPKLPNTDLIVRTIYEAYTDVMHHVDLGYFSSVKFDPATYTLKFNALAADYMFTAHYVDVNGVTNKTYKILAGQEGSIVLGKTAKYIVAYAVAPDIYTKSGTIVIDTVTNKITGYKMTIGG